MSRTKQVKNIFHTLRKNPKLNPEKKYQNPQKKSQNPEKENPEIPEKISRNSENLWENFRTCLSLGLDEYS